MISRDDLKPGCWGSAVFYRVGAAECSACPVAETCAKQVRERQITVVEAVGRFDNTFRTQRLGKVLTWFKARWKPPKLSENSEAKRAERVRASWTRDGINPFLLKHRDNPAKSTDFLNYETFRFILDVDAFKVRDVVEHLRETDETLSKEATEHHVKDACAGLLELGLLKREGRHVLCLA